MNPWFIWKGKNSLADYGLWCNKMPKRVKAKEKHEEVEIPGRAGSLILLEGEDVFSAYEDEISIIARNTLNIHEITNWLRGSGDLILYNDDTKAREVQIVGEVVWNKYSNDMMIATVPLLCQPFKKRRYSSIDRISTSSAVTGIYNPGDVKSKPYMSVTGSGYIGITIDGVSMGFPELSGTIDIDCDAELITYLDSGVRKIWTGNWLGEFWRVPVGSSSIAVTGGASIVFDPRWRWF